MIMKIYIKNPTGTGVVLLASSSPPPDVYQTGEHITNKIWIDGKPIYRYIEKGVILLIEEYSGMYHPLDGDGTMSEFHFDSVISANGFINFTAKYVPINTTTVEEFLFVDGDYTAMFEFASYIAIDANNYLFLGVASHVTLTNVPYLVVVEYTKK